MARQLTEPNGGGLRRTWVPPFALRRELGEMFDRLWHEEFPFGEAGAVPTMDISETEEGYRATLDVPGVESDNIDIQVHGNRVTIRGHREHEEEEKGRTFHRTERSSGSFSRSVTLPTEIAEDAVAASLEGGVLTIDLPKAAAAKPCKIKVQG